ncbi:MAG: VOC family protein [Methanomicrobiales archaeon]|nr:VOC family protein [Methanomicrobiales archaeon]
MIQSQMILGLSAVIYYVSDLDIAKKWYTVFLGVSPFFENQEFVEFHIGRSKHELFLIDKRYAGKNISPDPSGPIVYWHTDDVKTTLEKLISLGAKVYEPFRGHNGGYSTASVVDPFGNILGIMFHPYYERLNPHPLVVLNFA